MGAGETLKIVGWSMEKNTPWLGVKRGFKLARDHWIPGRRELEILSRALESTFTGASELARGVVLFHKAYSPSGGFGVEVYAHAAKLGLLAYEGGSWRFYPSGATASLLESLGFEPVELHGKGRVKGKSVTFSKCPSKASSYVLVSTGNYVGPARLVSKSPCRVKVKDMAPRGFKPLPSSSSRDALEVNREYIEALAAEAVEFLKANSGSRPVYVAVSGGLDSSVSLALAVEAFGAGNVVAVYADTGMEFKESLDTAERLASTLGVDLEVVSSHRDPFEEMKHRGLMGMENRWCTRLLKLEPLRAFYEKRGARFIVDGARALESDARASTPRVGVNPLIPFTVRLLPIHAWSRLEVQLYAELRDLPVNPLYGEGLHRIGCILCPAMHLHEMEEARRLYPGHYARIEEVLIDMGIRNPRDLLYKGEWRKNGVSPVKR